MTRQILSVALDFTGEIARGAIQIVRAVFGKELDFDLQRVLLHGKSMLGQPAKSKGDPAAFCLIDILHELADRASVCCVAWENDAIRRDVIHSPEPAPEGCALQRVVLRHGWLGGD